MQKTENQIIMHYEVFAERPSDQASLVPVVEEYHRRFGGRPEMVAGDAGFYSFKNEKAITAMAVKYISVPNRSTNSAERRK